MIILGVIHLKGLPGSPSNKLNLEEITELAQNDIDNLSKAGVNGIIVENFGDVPFVKNDVSKRTVASLTSVIQNLNIDSKRIRLITSLACSKGLQIIGESYPDLRIYASCVDPTLSKEGNIIPGIGDPILRLNTIIT